jgi:hypothetical protein
VSSSNIIDKKRDRKKAAYAINIENVHLLVGYHGAFATAVQNRLNSTRLKVADLPAEPKGWRSMLKHQYAAEWMTAATKEWQKLSEQGMFRFIPANTAKETPLPLMWIFKYKADSKGYLERFKARLVARGDLQFTEQDTFAATLTTSVFRFLIAISAAYNLEIKQFDAVNAYGNTILKQPITVECAEGFAKEGYVMEAIRGLYGLKISANLWYHDLKATMIELGLNSVPGVNCLFHNDWLVVVFYVDDILIFFHQKHADKVDNFERNLLQKYEIRRLGNVEHFLSIRVIRDRENQRIWLLQDA